MNRHIGKGIIWLTIVVAFLAINHPAAAQGRSQSSLDSNWRFFLGDPAGAETQGFDDRNWRTLDLPHDWSIEGPFDQMNATGGAGAFLPGGIGWYRKVFEIGGGDAKRRVFIEFDGVMANSEVWVNGVHMGKRPYGYGSFRYELTDHSA
jgi:beta-galactosidase